MPRSVPLSRVEGDVRLRDHRLEPVLRELVLAERAGEEAALSSRRSSSITNAPCNLVSVKIMISDLWRPDGSSRP